MSALWTAAEAAAATGGSLRGHDWAVQGVSIDSRAIAPGDLFVALTDRRDGHDFVADALARGAGAAMVARIPPGVAADAPLLLVGDVARGLAALGRAARARSTARVIAVTGSAGKTSTKEMLRTALAGQGRVHAAEKSFNNHWGVPLTLARMPREADFAVIEIGMNHPGEIAPLSALARPHVALITTVAPAHMAAFDGMAAIAREKASIFGGLEPGGVAVANADIDTFPILRDAAKAQGARLVTFGARDDADWRLVAARLHDEGLAVQAEHAGRPFLFRLATAGAHFATNALGALAAVAAAGADPAIAALDLARWQPPAGRGARRKVVLDDAEPGLSFELIDDAYNANPASMAASLATLAALAPADGVGRIGRGRRIAILGDMLELGAEEAAIHAALAQDPAMAAIDVVHCVGPRMKALHEALPPDRRGFHAATPEELAAQAHRLVDAGDVVLVKGSLGSRVRMLVDVLVNLGQGRGPEDEGAA